MSSDAEPQLRWAVDALVEEHGPDGAIDELQERANDPDDGLGQTRAYTAIGYVQEEHLDAKPDNGGAAGT